MECRVAFKISTNELTDNELDEIIDEIGIEPGITDYTLYYGMRKQDTEENFILNDLAHEALAGIISKKDILINLATRYTMYFTLDIKFSNLKYEIKRDTSFIIDEEIKGFINSIDGIILINNGAIEV